MRRSSGRLLTVCLVPLWLVACSGSDDGDAAAVGDASWCDVVADANALDDRFDDVADGDVGGLRSVIDEIAPLGDRFRAAKPDEIADQVEQYAAANDRLVQLFRDVDYVADDLDRDAVTEVIGQVDDVASEIDVYTVAECGEPLGPDDS